MRKSSFSERQTMAGNPSEQVTSQRLRPYSHKPALRGSSHFYAAWVALGAAAVLAAMTPPGVARVATSIYGAALTGLFTISAIYHRPAWPPQTRQWLRRADHAAIFVLIAGTATPFCLLALRGRGGAELLTIAWIGAAAGVLQSLFWVTAPKWLTASFYVILGWATTPYLPGLAAATDTLSIALLIGGGILYTLGAIVYGSKRPDPWPQVFGYHEVFHLLVIVAALCHFVAIVHVVRISA